MFPQQFFLSSVKKALEMSFLKLNVLQSSKMCILQTYLHRNQVFMDTELFCKA